MLVVGFTAVLAVPLVVALVALRRPQWYPLTDLALIEMRLRDIGTASAPLTGLVGRFPVGDQRAAHPGPLGFYGLWPFYRLLGSSAYSLLAASVAVHVLAIASLLWVASRRGRIGLLLGVSFVVALARARLRRQRAHRGLEPAPARALVARVHVRHLVRALRRPAAPARRLCGGRRHSTPAPGGLCRRLRTGRRRVAHGVAPA
jgi:hypothetical protein